MSYTNEKIMLAFSYMAYLGYTLTGSDRCNENKILKKIEEAIKNWKPFKGQDWEVAWGPAVYSLPANILDDAMMYVVKKNEPPELPQYVIVIRGTNPISILDWIVNDFQVENMLIWPYGTHGSLKPKISESTYRGLNQLQTMTPSYGIPGHNKTILQFLNEELQDKEADVCLTGHSKGGALSSTMALYLKDIQGSVFIPNANISTVAFAGPTAGDADFARYFDQCLGSKCNRIANSLDIAPYGWNTKSLRKLRTLYLRAGKRTKNFTVNSSEFIISIYKILDVLLPAWLILRKRRLYPTILERILLLKKILDSKGNNYTQIKADAPPLNGRLNQSVATSTYLLQAIYQHVWAYPELMGMMDDIPVNEIFLLEKNVPDLLNSHTVSWFLDRFSKHIIMDYGEEFFDTTLLKKP